MISLIFVASGTRGIGFIGYAVAAATCAYAWEKTAQKRAWSALTILQFLLLFDLVFNWRWHLHDRFVGIAVADNVYDQRRWPQKVILALLFVAMIALALHLWRRFQRRGGLTVAVVATVLSVALRLVEVVSWHKSDTILHYPLAGGILVNFLWFGLGLATAAGVFAALRYPAFGWR
jgi:hypothetical protein